jgi:hypothetical protein
VLKINKFRVGFEILTTVVVKSTIFCDITPCSPLSFNRRFGETSGLHLQAIKNNNFSKKTSVDSQRTTWRHIPEDCTLQISLMFIWIMPCHNISDNYTERWNCFSRWINSQGLHIRIVCIGMNVTNNECPPTVCIHNKCDEIRLAICRAFRNTTSTHEHVIQG